MELFWLEHRKLWRKGSVRICVFLSFVYVVLVGEILCFQWFSFGSSRDFTSAFGNNFDGYGMIRGSQEYARTVGTELTDETLQQMVRDYQRMSGDGMKKQRQLADWQIINSWLQTLYPELEEPGDYRTMISYVEPERLTGFYERRTRAIEEFLKLSGQEGEEKAYLMAMNQKVKTPFSYEWTEGWSQILGSMVAELGMVMALFLAIALSPMFAGEWDSKTGPLILSTKGGREKIAVAKVLTGLAFAAEFFAVLAAGAVGTQLFYMGTSGWDMPIQTIKLIAVAPLNMLQAEVYEYAFTLLGAVGFAGVVMLLSAAVKSNVSALLLSLCVVYGPMMIAEYLPFEMQKALDLLPLVGSGADIFRTNVFCLFGKLIWSPYLLISVPVLIGAVCAASAVKRWAKMPVS